MSKKFQNTEISWKHRKIDGEVLKCIAESKLATAYWYPLIQHFLYSFINSLCYIYIILKAFYISLYFISELKRCQPIYYF